MAAGAQIVGRIAVRVLPDLTGFRERLQTELRGMNLEVPVDVVPDLKGFHSRISAAVAAAEANEVNIRVRVDDSVLDRLQRRLAQRFTLAGVGDGVDLSSLNRLERGLLAASVNAARLHFNLKQAKDAFQGMEDHEDMSRRWQKAADASRAFRDALRGTAAAYRDFNRQSNSDRGSEGRHVRDDEIIRGLSGWTKQRRLLKLLGRDVAFELGRIDKATLNVGRKLEGFRESVDWAFSPIVADDRVRAAMDRMNERVTKVRDRFRELRASANNWLDVKDSPIDMIGRSISRVSKQFGDSFIQRSINGMDRLERAIANPTRAIRGLGSVARFARDDIADFSRRSVSSFKSFGTSVKNAAKTVKDLDYSHIVDEGRRLGTVVKNSRAMDLSLRGVAASARQIGPAVRSFGRSGNTFLRAMGRSANVATKAFGATSRSIISMGRSAVGAGKDTDGFAKRMLSSFSALPKALVSPITAFGNLSRTGKLVVAVLSVLPGLLALVMGLIAGLPSLLFAAGAAFAAVALGMDGIKEAAKVLAPDLEAMKKSISANWKDGLTPIFQQLKPLFPVITDGLNAVTDGMIDWAAAWADTLVEANDLGMIEEILGNIGKLFSDMTPFMDDSLRGILNWTLAGSRNFEKLSGVMNKFGDDWEQMTKRTSENGTFDKAMSGLADSFGTFFNEWIFWLEYGVGAMGRLGPSISNFISGFSATMMALMPLLEGIFIAVSGALAGIGNLLGPVMQSLAGPLTQVGQILSDTFLSLGVMLGNVLGQIGTAIAPFLTQMLTTIGEHLQVILGFLGEALSAVMPVLTSLFAAIMPLIQTLLAAILPVFQAVAAALVPLITTLAGAIGQIITAIAPILTTIVGFIAQIITALTPLIDIFAQLFTQVIAIMVPIITQFIQILQPIVTLIGQALVQAVQALMPVVQILATAFISVLQAVAPLLPVVAGLIAQLVSAFLPVIMQLIPIITRLVEILVGALVPLIQMLVPVLMQMATAWAQIWIALAPLIPVLANLAVVILKGLVDIIMALVPAILPLITMALPVLVSLVQALVPIITAIVEAITPLIPIIVSLATTIISILAPVFEGLMAVIVRVMPFIVQIIQGAVDIILGIVNVFSGILSGNWSQVWDGVLQILKGAWNLITGFLGGLLSLVIGIVVDLGKGIIEGIWNGITSMLGWFKDQIFGFFSSIMPDWVKKALGINSPSKVMRKIARWLMPGFGLGMDDTAGVVFDTMGRIVDKTMNIAEGLDLSAIDMGVPGGMADIMKADMGWQAELTHTVEDAEFGSEPIEVTSVITLDGKTVAKSVNKTNRRTERRG